MEGFDPDRIRAFTTEEHWNPGAIVTELRKRVEELKDFTDLIGKSRAAKISDSRIIICQDLLNAYETTLFAYAEPKKLGSLSNGQQREILVMVEDILRGKREYAHFQLNRNADGIKELFSNKVFTLK